MYDTNIVQETVVNMHKDYGYHYQKEDLRFMPPSVVGEIVAQILSSK
ncbi:MAG: hypothetical protein LBG59_03740 [Candidatus Peribacteria bacterium]|jgi:hypothetical protein|nr:hypothetical protein [Candidatus Peribacteria bacterium]